MYGNVQTKKHMALVDRTSERVVGVLMYPAPMKKRPCFFPLPALYTALASIGEFMTSKSGP